MTPRILAASIWTVTAALAIIVSSLVVRNAIAIPAHVPLDPNEGWNAAFALSVIDGHGLYPRPGMLMVNNYPPLSFYLVAAIAKAGADAVVAGRWLALTAFVVTVLGISAVLLRMHCRLRAVLFGTLFFPAMMLVTSDYVGIDDPQMLGHALQVLALIVLLEAGTILPAFVFALSLFIKHNLIAMPLAAALWLLVLDRPRGTRFVLWGLVFCLAGLLACRLVFHTELIAQLQSPRVMSLSNLRDAVTGLWWVALPALAMLGAWPDREILFCALYAAVALLLGLIFSIGDGVDANAFFDLGIALSLALGLVVERGRFPLLACLSALPLLIHLSINFDQNNFFFTHEFALQSSRDIAFLKHRPGPALCDQLSLCLWAGKDAQVDVFNLGEAIKTGARDPSALTALIARHHYASLQMVDLTELGADVRNSILKYYRIDHSDDNGTFLIPAKREP